MHEYFEIGNLHNRPFLDKAVHDEMFLVFFVQV